MDLKTKKARDLCVAVELLCKTYGLSFFFLTEGASITRNNGDPAIRHARKSHEEWERQNGYDPDEDWGLESITKMFQGANARATVVPLKDHHKSDVVLLLDKNIEYHMKLNSEFERYITDDFIDYHQASENQVNDKNCKIAVATSYNGILGYIMYKNDTDYIIVRDFYVDSMYRGEGIGSKLMDYVVEHRNGKPIRLNCMKENKTGYKFYIHYGFKLDRISKGTEYKIDDYVMIYE